MSLQLAAQHMASRGRGPDTTLVHMAPQEVAGLQALAMRHGGSLTVNPDTGLPEAGFLSSILPTVIGAGLSIASGGTLTPLMAAGITGAGFGLATGSLKKGLMAGLGAYGGAGLAGGLTAAGAAGTAGTAGAVETGLTASSGVMGANPMVAQPMTFGAETLASTAPSSVASSAGTAANSIPSTYATNPERFASNAYNASPIRADMAVPTVTKAPTISDRFSQAFQGAKNLSTPEGRELFMGNAASKGVEAKGIGGMKGLMQYGLTGLGPAVLELMTPEQRAAEEKAKLQPKNFNFAYNQRTNPNAAYTGAQTGERLHFDPIYTPITAAGGGLMDTGPVQAMSDRNQAETLMANQGQMFAEGGETKAVKPVEQDPYYTMSGQSGDAFKYLMGQMPAPSRAPAPAAAPVQSAVQAAPAPTSNSPFDGVFGKIVQGLPSSAQSEFNNQVAGNRGLQLLTGGAQPQDQGAGGYWADAPGSIKPYTFDPNTGTFTAAPAPKVWVPYTPAPAPAYLGGDGGYGGFDGGAGASSSSASGGGGGMSNQGEGGPDGVGGWAHGGIASLAQGGPSHLGDYSDGGRLLKGPGDGVSDSIPASIANKRPARLADGEFVVPARIVSELGNGSTEAGARKLYAMMDRVQKARKKSIGKNRVAVNSRTEKLLPA